MLSQQYAVGTFPNYEITETALRDLKANDFLMERVSLIGRDVYGHPEVTEANMSNRPLNAADFDTLLFLTVQRERRSPGFQLYLLKTFALVLT